MLPEGVASTARPEALICEVVPVATLVTEMGKPSCTWWPMTMVLPASPPETCTLKVVPRMPMVACGVWI